MALEYLEERYDSGTQLLPKSPPPAPWCDSRIRMKTVMSVCNA